MAYDYSKLCGKIIEKFGTYRDFAKAIGIAEYTLSMRLNNKSPWKQDEIENSCEVLGIKKSKDVNAYFFTKNVQ